MYLTQQKTHKKTAKKIYEYLWYQDFLNKFKVYMSILTKWTIHITFQITKYHFRYLMLIGS